MLFNRKASHAAVSARRAGQVLQHFPSSLWNATNVRFGT
jgi:hypothetical protein